MKMTEVQVVGDFVLRAVEQEAGKLREQLAKLRAEQTEELAELRARVAALEANWAAP